MLLITEQPRATIMTSLDILLLDISEMESQSWTLIMVLVLVSTIIMKEVHGRTLFALLFSPFLMAGAIGSTLLLHRAALPIFDGELQGVILSSMIGIFVAYFVLFILVRLFGRLV